MQTHTLNIIGAGRLGLTLGKLFHRNNCFRIIAVCNSSIGSAQKAVEFIGAGTACATLDQMPHADAIMITTPDAWIKGIAQDLSLIPLARSSKFAFHCSGVTTSEVLSPLKKYGVATASVHPNMTFASASVSVDHFVGTHCGFEGDENVFAILENAFRKIGGHIFRLSAENKALYHAATVMSSNYLIALMDVVVDLYQQIGLSKENAMAIMQPVVTKTVSNVFSLGTVEALTGPVARGDAHTVQQHLDAMKSTYISDLYTHLGLRLL